MNNLVQKIFWSLVENILKPNQRKPQQTIQHEKLPCENAMRDRRVLKTCCGYYTSKLKSLPILVQPSQVPNKRLVKGICQDGQDVPK